MEIQTTVEEFPEKIRRLKISPKAPIRVIIDDTQIKTTEPPQKSRWAEIAERISKESPLSEEAGKELRRLSREFRDNFRFREPPHFEHIEDDD